MLDAANRAAVTSLAETGVPRDMGVSLDVLLTICKSDLWLKLSEFFSRVANLDVSIVLMKVGSGCTGGGRGEGGCFEELSEGGSSGTGWDSGEAGAGSTIRLSSKLFVNTRGKVFIQTNKK